jgi:hypothetical protein
MNFIARISIILDCHRFLPLSFRSLFLESLHALCHIGMNTFIIILAANAFSSTFSCQNIYIHQHISFSSQRNIIDNKKGVKGLFPFSNSFYIAQEIFSPTELFQGLTAFT